MFRSHHYPLEGLIHLGVVYVVWSSTYLAIRVAVQQGSGFPPFLMSGSRMLVAGIILVLWVIFRRERLTLRPAVILPLFVSALCLWPGRNGLVTWAEQRAESGYAALLIGATPIWGLIIESLLDRRRPTGTHVFAIVTGFAGLAVLSAPRLATAARADVLAVVALVAAPIFWAAGSILQRRRPTGLGSAGTSAYQQLIGGLALLAIAALVHEPAPVPTGAAWAAWSYLVIVASVITFNSYVRALELLPYSVVVTYAYVNPVLGVILGALLLHERITPETLIGAALLLVGVAGVFHSQRVQAGQPVVEA